MGTGRYCHLPPEDQLDSVPPDIRATASLFADFGYECVLSGLGEYDGAEQLRQKLSHWSADTKLSDDDVVVVYFAGHGAVEERDRHYLLCWDTRDTDLAATALATEDLVRILCKGGLRHLLLILDTCSAGAGTAEASAAALQTIIYRGAAADASAGLWFLASARRKELALDGAFVSVLGEAIATTTERTGQRQQYLDLTELVKAVNERFDAAGRGQRAELASALVTGLAPFLANSGYREELPPAGTDLEVQGRVAARELAEHFGPRSRGVEFESEQGLYFSGRVNVLAELAAWLTAEEGDGRGRVVTGVPGCGKSAVLGRIVALSDPAYRARLDLSDVDPSTVVPKNCVTAAVHARHKRLEEIVERIASALGTEADGAATLLQELTRRGRQGPPLVIVVDAVDEAGSDTAADAGGHGEPRRITRELLRPMAEIQGVRLLVGTRRELVTPLGPTFTCMDLDREEYRAGIEDVTAYVARVLLAAEEAEVRTPYRDRRGLAWTVARGVADKAAGVYLYARMTARTLRSDEVPVDVGRLGWEENLPSEVGDAFDDYLARFGPDEPRVRRMLLALAFSEGKGLPRGRVWTGLSSAISGVPCSEEDVSWALDVAAAYIAEVVDDDRRSAYRLYHKALAEHLRATAAQGAPDIQHAVVDALTGLVPQAAAQQPDWFAAVPYVRQHLATHAVAAGRLAELMEDPGFLLASEPLTLLRAFAAMEGEGVPGVRGAYEQIAHRLTPDTPLGDRAADLQLSARRCQADRLADRVDELAVARPWSTAWAWWSTSGAHRLLGGHDRPVGCVAVGALDGRPIAVTGSEDSTARVWDLTTQRQIGEPLPVGIPVNALAIGELGDYTVALTGGDDGTVRVWDLSAGQEYGEPLGGHTNRILSIAMGEVHGRPMVLTGSSDGTARLWDLQDRRQLGRPLAAHRRSVRAVDLGRLDGRPIALTGGDDKAVHVWDLDEVLEGGDARLDGNPLIGPAGDVQAVCAAELDGRSIALVGDSTGMLSCWDLAGRRQIGEPVEAHTEDSYASGLKSAVVGEFGGRPVVLTSSRQGARLWDLRTLRQLGQPMRGHLDTMTAGALAVRGEASLAVTVGADHTARIWDLAADQPDLGHTRSVSATAFCEMGGRPLVVTGGVDGTARVWDLRTRKQLGAALEGHTGDVRAVAATVFQGRLIVATGGSDTRVRLWVRTEGRIEGAELAGHTNAVACVAFGSLAARPVLISGSEDGTVLIWDVESGAPLGLPLTGHVGDVQHLAVRCDGGALEVAVATSLAHAYVWRVAPGADGPSARRLGHRSVRDLFRYARTVGVAFHHGRAVVLAAMEGNNIHVREVVSGDLVAGPFPGHAGGYIGATFVRLGTESLVATSGDVNQVRVWRAERYGEEGPLPEPAWRLGPVNRYAPPVFGRVDGAAVVITTGYPEVSVWDLSGMHPVGEPLCGAEKSLVSADIIDGPDGRPMVVTGSSTGVVRQHDLTDGSRVAPQLTHEGSLRHISTVQVDGQTMVIRCNWAVTEAWDVVTRRRLVKRPGAAHMTHTFRSGDRQVMVSADEDNVLEAWDLHTQATVCGPMSGHTFMVSALRDLMVDGVHTLASASHDGTVRLWNLETGNPVGAPMTGYVLGATALELVRLDGTELAVIGSGDGHLHVRRLDGGRMVVGEFPPFASAVSAIRFAEVRGVPTLVAADRHGLLRVGRMNTFAWTSEINVGSSINGFSVDREGHICVATDMGVVALTLTEVRP
ncbi:caspase family protein [Streptomyces sp. NBC_00091]|uniref:caspase family protein n=1 Tax=Streptomyces sp. NBC_00091 TaxID=2975648 RepID=UPI0022531108|nr:caspase family protein [Streptomyces sp. NBC_00091]MCX5379800.1 caspase family protein [Streptomyces sp. NBC_00091]